LNYFIGTDIFRKAFMKASENQKDEAETLLNQNDLQALEAWAKRIIEERKDYGAYSIRALRLEAQRLGVQGYSYLSKASLLSALENEERNAAQSNGLHNNPFPNCESVSGNEAVVGALRDSGISYQSDDNGRDGFAGVVQRALPNPA
jgi:hypothetical protein